LVGEDEVARLRAGGYRVLFAIATTEATETAPGGASVKVTIKTVSVYKVGHRREIYRDR